MWPPFYNESSFLALDCIYFSLALCLIVGCGHAGNKGDGESAKFSQGEFETIFTAENESHWEKRRELLLSAIDVSGLETDEEFEHYVGKFVYFEGATFQTKAVTGVRNDSGGFPILSHVRYEWPTEVVGKKVHVYGNVAYQDLREGSERGI